MSLVINTGTMESKSHFFSNYIAFLDDDGDFWLVDEEGGFVSRLTDRGCHCESITEYDTIEDFLRLKFSCKLVKAFERVDEFKIIVEC